MMNWLLPRLKTFKDAHPAIELRLDVNYGQVDFVRDEISVAIRNNTIPPPADVILRDLMREWIGPVCAPEYARTHPIAQPGDLETARLLSTRTRPHAWTDWARSLGHSKLTLEPQDAYEHFYLLIQAAACGLGVALVPRMLVEGDLQAGRLVAPCGFVPGPYKLVLWIARHLRARPDVRALAGWLESEMSKPLEPQGSARLHT
jgi:DNA-binding transcriptional LysR family regulator